MLSFAKIESGAGKYPKQIYDDKEDQSYGFNPARKLQTGVMRGTHTIVNADGSKITLGKVPGTIDEFGIAFFDADGTQIFKLTGATLFMYDSDTGLNNLQLGTLPDGSTGLVIAKDGYSVDEAFS